MAKQLIRATFNITANGDGVIERVVVGAQIGSTDDPAFTKFRSEAVQIDPQNEAVVQALVTGAVNQIKALEGIE